MPSCKPSTVAFCKLVSYTGMDMKLMGKGMLVLPYWREKVMRFRQQWRHSESWRPIPHTHMSLCVHGWDYTQEPPNVLLPATPGWMFTTRPGSCMQHTADRYSSLTRHVYW